MTRATSIAIILSAAVVALGPMASAAEGGPPKAGEGGKYGGFIGIHCDDGLWCDPDQGSCGGADISGVCVKIASTCKDIAAPVCGCGGHTYPNDCEREKVEIAKKSDGACD
jgi:hypothetical protein